MQFALYTALTSLAIGTHAAAIPPRQGADNPRLAQFRVFSAAGCSDLNEGFYTIDTDQSNQCHDVSDVATSTTANGYVSIELQAVTGAAADCKLLLYSDSGCSEDETESPLNQCENATVVQGNATYPTWNSYYYNCD